MVKLRCVDLCCVVLGRDAAGGARGFAKGPVGLREHEFPVTTGDGLKVVAVVVKEVAGVRVDCPGYAAQKRPDVEAVNRPLRERRTRFSRADLRWSNARTAPTATSFSYFAVT